MTSGACVAAAFSALGAVVRRDHVVAGGAQARPQEPQDLRLVVDDQYPVRRHGRPPAIDVVSFVAIGSSIVISRSATVDDRALGPDRPTHAFDDTGTDRQPETRAGRTAIAARDTIELVEHLLQGVGRNADAMVADRQRDLGRFGTRPSTSVTELESLYLWALSSRLNRTCSSRAASPRMSGNVSGIAVVDPAHRKGLARTLDGARNDIADIDPVAADVDRAGFEPRHVEQVRDEARQAAGFLLDGRQQVARGRISTCDRRACAGS